MYTFWFLFFDDRRFVFNEWSLQVELYEQTIETYCRWRLVTWEYLIYAVQMRALCRRRSICSSILLLILCMRLRLTIEQSVQICLVQILNCSLHVLEAWIEADDTDKNFFESFALLF